MQAKQEMEAIKALNTKVEGIVESGSNDNGSWVKFADGTMICGGQISQTLTRATQRSGCGGYRTSGVTVNFPTAFIETPQLSLLDTSSTDFSLNCRSSSVNTSYFNVFWYAINSNSSQLNYKADYIAIGKWK